jgi:putative peptide zinc metalloprotease protein
MARSEDRSVREAERLRPRLRQNLHASIRDEGGSRFCVLEDPLSMRFYRIGLDEWRFFRELDGRRSVATILAQMARSGGGETFGANEALQMLGWLKDRHLLVVEQSGTTDQELAARAASLTARWLNPLVLRIPLSRPDRFFSTLEPHLRPALGWIGFLAWLLVVTSGASKVAIDWESFRQGFDGFLAPDNWFWIALVWVGLKVLHELAHGIFCKHYGAAVREIGLLVILFIPMGYVDATASVAIPSRARRIMVAAAGMYAEFFAAGIAAWVWSGTQPGILNTVAHNAIVTGTVVTLLFNANPLMRFDGYFILAELLGIPNLATGGRQWMTGFLAWLVSGIRSFRPEPPEHRQDRIIALYGIASWLWQILVTAGLLVAGSVLFKGGGILLSAIAVFGWVAMPVVRFFKMIANTVGRAPGRWTQIGLRLGLAAAAVAAILFAPFHRKVAGHGIVEMADTRILRAECPGFVESVSVADGQTARAGAVLVTLNNEQAKIDLVRRELDLAKQRLTARLAYTRGEVAEFQAESAKSRSLESALRESREFVGSLAIKAPTAGQVTGIQLDRIQGAFFPAGSEVLRIGRGQEREIRIAVSQRDAPHFKPILGLPIDVRIDGRGARFKARVERIEENATTDLIHPALTAIGGGAIGVKPIRETARPEASDPDPARATAYELATPHFVVIARIDGGESLHPGERARIRFKSPRRITLHGECRAILDAWWKARTRDR